MPPIRWHKAGEVWSDAQRIRILNPERFIGTPTGIKALDNIGWMKTPFFGALVAKNKFGKTAFLLTMALAFAKAGFVVLFDILEMTVFQMVTRQMANGSNTDMDTFDYIRGDFEDWARVAEFMQEMEKYDGYWTEGRSTPKTLTEDLNWIKKLHPNRKILLVVDYVQLMQSAIRVSEYENQETIGKYLKFLCHPEECEPDQLTPEIMLGLEGSQISVLTAAQVIVSVKRGLAKVTDASAASATNLGNVADILFAGNQVMGEDGVTVIPNQWELTMTGRYTRGGVVKVGFNGAQARVQDLEQPSIQIPLYTD